jgi:HSP20 family protein
MKLIKRMDGLLPAMWDNFSYDDWFVKPNNLGFGTGLPAVNIQENDNEFHLELAVPGMKKSDFKIDVDNNVLTISSEERTEDESTEANYTRREFYYNNFRRSFTLPETVDSDKIAAEYTDGVLAILIPKKEEAKPKPAKTIQIA